MFPLSPEEIQSLDADCPERLAALDDSGLFPGPRETAEEFRERLLYQQQAFAELDRELAERGEAEAFEGVVVRADCRIPDEIVEEAAECTRSLYGFSGRHVPGFFLSQGVGPLWGGCAIGDTESGLTVFLIRSSFRARRRWFVYDRRELLAHELCHAARQCLGDLPLEGYFAYQTSPSRLRRYLGNCFIREYDAIWFVIPALLLLLADTAAKIIMPPVILPIGALMSFVGGPMFLFLLFKGRDTRG